MKTYRFILCRCDGKIEKMTTPSIFDPYEVANRLPHSLVFTFIPTGHSVMTESLTKVEGPKFVLTTAENGGTHYAIPDVPIVDEKSAYFCYRNRF